jgi:hypothetical protein
MIEQYLSNKTKVVLFIGLKFFQHLNVAKGYIAIANPAHLTSPHTPTAEETERQRDTGIGERKKCVVSLAACPRPASSSLYKAKPTRQPERGVAFTPSSDRQGQRLERERSSSSS